MKQILFIAGACFLLLVSTVAEAQMKRFIKNMGAGQVRTNNKSSRTSSCIIDSIVLTTQAQINNFSSNFPGCTTPAYLIINGAGANPAITNLNGLLSLNEVTNVLDIRHTSITNLSGLNNLTIIGDTLRLEDNSLMSSIGLTNINRLGDLYLHNLPALANIDGISNNIDTIGEVHIDSTALTNLNGLSSIVWVNGGLGVAHSPVTSLSALTNLTHIEGYLFLDSDTSITNIGINTLTGASGFLFSNLPNLTSIAGLTNNFENGNIGTFWMINTGLTDLTGLDSLTSSSNFYLWFNPITSLHGLENLKGNITYGISLWGNNSLADISALSNVTSISDGLLEIFSNNSLVNAFGFHHINLMGNGLWVKDNASLTSLNFLDSALVIQNNNGDKLLITGNNQLAVCSSRPVCNYLANGDSAIIEFNAPGCASVNEVLSACNVACSLVTELTWNGNNSSDWNDSTNWTPAGIPGMCTKVIIPDNFAVSYSPSANNNISIGGLVMEPGAELSMNFYGLNITQTFQLDNANIYDANYITATRIFEPKVYNSSLDGNFTCRDYIGLTEFIGNTFLGNTLLSDSTGRVHSSATFFNSFYGNLNFVNNSDHGQMYLSNASPNHDYVEGDLTVINTSSADISIGLGGGNPLHVNGSLIINSSNGGIDINNFTFTGNQSARITQAGSLPVTINRLYMQKFGRVTLDQDVFINNYLEFGGFSGDIISDTNKLLVLENGSAAVRQFGGGCVIGPLKKIGNQAFAFPIGVIENNTRWIAPLSITAPELQDDEFTARYFHHNPGNDGFDTSLYSPGFGNISGKEYWKLTRNNGNSKVKVTLSYDSGRSGPSPFYRFIQVAGWNGTIWNSLGTSGFTGQMNNGTVSSTDSLSVFNALTFSFKPIRKPVITIGNVDSVRCLGTSFYVPFTLDTTIIQGELFWVEISDTLGNFTTGFRIGEKNSSVTSDSILCYLNFGFIPGKNYRIRLLSYLFPDTSINTKKLMPVRAPQLTFNISGQNPACLGNGIQKYYPSVTEPNVIYNWTLNGGGLLTTNGDTATINWTSTGNYNLTLRSSNNCGNGFQRTIQVQVNPPAPTTTPTINNSGRWIYSSQAGINANYSWYRNDILVIGATSSAYYAAVSGNYTSKYSNSCGAGPVSNTISFVADAVAQSITFPAIADRTYGDLPFTPVATATSGLPVAFVVVSGPATINAQTNLLTITGTGVVTVRANQQGDNSFDTAASVTHSFTVNKASQAITFQSIPGQDYGNPPVTLSAASTSGLLINYTIISGPALLTGNMLTLTGVGTVTVSASQAGNENYLPATTIGRSFCTRVTELNAISGFSRLCPGTATYSVNNIPGATYLWRIAGGNVLPSTTNTAVVNWAVTGTFSLIVSATGNCGNPSDNDTIVVQVIDNIQPDSVQNMLPANGVINQQLPLTLSWIPAKPDLFYTYDLYLWRADLPQPSTAFAANLTTVNYTIPLNSGLAYNQTYKWMVVSHNGSCIQINTGPVQEFSLIPLPDLVVNNVQVPATAFSGQTISINWTVSNSGPGKTNTNQSWTDAVFLSFDTVPNFNAPPNTNPGAWNILDFPVKPLLVGTRQNVSALDPGQQYSNSLNFTLPVNYSLPLYAYVITNYPASGNAPIQESILNDTARAREPVIVTLSPTPDLRVDTVFTPTTTFSGSTINLTYKVKNYGVLTPSGTSWTDKIYISQSPLFNINSAIPVKLPKFNGTYYANAADAVAGNITQLLADSFYTRNLEIVVPNFIFGSYFVYVIANATSSLYEGALNNNNINRSAMQVFLTPTPHLTVSSLAIPVNTASTSQPIGVNWNITNTGFNDNIEKNKGHYFVQSGTCLIYHACPEGPPGTACDPPPPTPGVTTKDSVGFGSSYWLDRVYLSADSSALDITNAVLVSQTSHGQENSGFLVDDNLNLSFPCRPVGTNLGQSNVNTFNVIKPGSNHPKAASFTVPSHLPQGNYFVFVTTNATKTVFEYPGTAETRRSAFPILVQRPDVIVSAVTAPAGVTGGQPFSIQYNIVNNGPGAIYNHFRRDRVYISTSPIFDGNAELIATPAFTEDLPVGNTVTHTLSYVLPVAASGNRYIFVHTNFDSAFRENNQDNNRTASGVINVSPATANDLIVSSIQLADTVSVSGLYFKYTVSNNGSGITAGRWVDSIFISCNPTFTPASGYFIGLRSQNEILPAGGSYTDSFNLTIPFTFNINGCFPESLYSTAYFFVKTNANNVVYEGSNGNNNVGGSGSKVVFNPLVDHIVTLVTGGDTATVARPYRVTRTIKNIGFNPGQGYLGWSDAVYFSTDSILNSNAILARSMFENRTLNQNQTYSDSKDVTPPNIATGDYYVLVKTDNYAQIGAEKVKSNNVNLLRNNLGVARKIHVVQPLLPDLTDTLLSAPAVVAIGQPITTIHKMINKGAGVTYPDTWSNAIWLSTDFIPNNGNDVLLSAKNHSGALQPGQDFTDSITSLIPLNIIPGNYVLISQVNSYGNVFESNSSNNLAYRYITVYKPAPSDLVVENIMKPDTVLLGYTLDTSRWIIYNNSVNAATGISSDGIYLSLNNTLDSSAILIGIKNKTINMAPLSRDTITLNPLITNVIDGDYTVLVKTDLLNNILESNKDNNNSVALSKLHVGVKELPINVVTLNTLYNISRFYKLVVPDSLTGATIRVTLKTSDSLTMKNQMFIGKGYVPSAANFDFTYDTPNYGNQQIVMTSVTAGVYYISLRSVSAIPVIQNITLKAEKLPFLITSVHSPSGGNTGNVTIKISGSLFNNNMLATLSRAGTTVTASAVYFSNSTLVYATFNLQGKALGLYDVSLLKADTTVATLLNGFSVVNANNGGLITGGGINTGPGNGNEPGCEPGAASGLNSQLVTELVIPEKVFGGWPFVIQLNYNNPTNVDIPAQVRILYSERDIKMSHTPEGVAEGTTSLYLELTEQNGPPGIIRAGGSGTIRIYGKAPLSIPGHTYVLFNLK